MLRLISHRIFKFSGQPMCHITLAAYFVMSFSNISLCQTDNCGDGAPACDIDAIDGFMGDNTMAMGATGDTICINGEDQLIQNAIWFSFVAGNTEMTVDYILTNCVQGTTGCTGDGVQIAIWSGCPSSGTCVAGSADCITTDGSVNLSGLDIGGVYNFVLDGCCGSTCTVELDITVSDWSFDIPNTSDITVTSDVDPRACEAIAPNVFCPGQDIFFIAEGDNGIIDMDDVGATFSWTIDGPNPSSVQWDAVVASGNGPNINYGTVGVDATPGNNIVAMIFDEVGTYEVCLTEVSTYCDVSIGGDVCHSITIMNLPVQDFGEYDLCYTAMAIDGDEFIPPPFTDPGSGIIYEWSAGESIGIADILASNGLLTYTIGDCCLIEQQIRINLVGSIDPGVVEIPLYVCQIPYTYNVNGESIIIDDIESFSNYNEQLFGASDTQDYNGNICDSLIVINAVRIELADSVIVESTPNGISIFLDIYRTDGEDFELIDANYTWRDTLTGLVVGTGNPVILPSGLHYCVYDGLVLDVLTGDEVPCSGILGSYIILNDIEDCIIDLQDDIISSNANELIEINILDNDIFPNEYDIQLVGSNLPAIDSIDLDNSGNLSLILNNDFSEQLTLSYEVCSPDCIECETADIIIRNAILENLIFTNVISPDNDGQNDILRFNTDDVIPDSKITIYNRWGDAIYSEENYTNEWNAEGYPGGIYFYVLEVNGIIIKKTLTVLK